jgi:hypothetical protein
MPIAFNTRSASAANASIVRDTVGSEATSPNTAGSPRSTATSARQSPPNARATARSHTTLAGSCRANGLRHGANARDNSAPSLLARTASASSTPPARDTTPEPAASTRTQGYNPVVFTWKVLLGSARHGPRQTTSSLVRSTFQFNDTSSHPTGMKAPG